MAFIPPKPAPYYDPWQDFGQGQDPQYQTLDELGLDPLAEPPAADTTVVQPPAKQILQNTFNGGRDIEAKTPAKRDATNDFGYINKPGFMGIASAVAPGPLGLAAKAVNAGININNQSAVSGARQMLGLPEKKGIAGGALSDNKGYVGDVSINDHNYPVGFEAETPTGRTTLTPNEALTRANTLGGLSEVDKPASENANSGIFGGVLDHAKGLFSSIFGTESKSPQLTMDTSKTSAQRMASFPTAPKAQPSSKPQANPNSIAGPWGGAGNIGSANGGGRTGFGTSGNAGQSVGPSGGGKSWGGPR